MKQLTGFKHKGFCCMDTLRDKEILEKKLKKKILTPKKILITGGTGFIGFHLAKKCLKKRLIVTSLSTTHPQKRKRLKNVSYLICDISKKELKKDKKIMNMIIL